MDHYFSSENTGGNYQPPLIDPNQPVLAVAPLSYVPYMGPTMLHNNINMAPLREHNKIYSTMNQWETEASEKVGPAILFLPQHTTRAEWNNILATTTTGVALRGSAAMGKVGPVIGIFDIGESEDSYFFRVSLPGVVKGEGADSFSCIVNPDGYIVINGMTNTSQYRVLNDGHMFQMQTNYLCPNRCFSVDFQLPGPVNNQTFNGNFGNTGIFEGIVKKT